MNSKSTVTVAERDYSQQTCPSSLPLWLYILVFIHIFSGQLISMKVKLIINGFIQNKNLKKLNMYIKMNYGIDNYELLLNSVFPFKSIYIQTRLKHT